MVAGKRVKDLLAQVGLTKSANKKMKKLSGGMKRRAGIAQAMLNNPKFLFWMSLRLDLIQRKGCVLGI